jgi:hypothetical protein
VTGSPACVTGAATGSDDGSEPPGGVAAENNRLVHPTGISSEFQPPLPRTLDDRVVEGHQEDDDQTHG